MLLFWPCIVFYFPFKEIATVRNIKTIVGLALILALIIFSNQYRVRQTGKIWEKYESQMKAEDYTGAVKTLEKSLLFTPNNAGAYFMIGMVYYKNLFELEKARHYFSKYIELFPHAPNVEQARELLAQVEARISENESAGVVVGEQKV